MDHAVSPLPLKRGFTLVELLVVISIIAVLMGLLIPVSMSVVRNAKKTQAKSDALQIATAIRGYFTEYGRYPIEVSGADVILSETQRKALYTALTVYPKSDSVVARMNPKQILFLEAPEAKKGKGGFHSATGDYLDPWGRPFEIVLDADYDNQIATMPEPFHTEIQNQPLRTPVALFSRGDIKEGEQDVNVLRKAAVTTW